MVIFKEKALIEKERTQEFLEGLNKKENFEQEKLKNLLASKATHARVKPKQTLGLKKLRIGFEMSRRMLFCKK